MLRVASKRSVEQGIKSVRQQSTAPPSGPHAPPSGPHGGGGPKKGGGGKGGLALVGATLAGAGGVVGYAYVDPEFRHKVESTVPQVKPVFDTLLGSASLSKTKNDLTHLKDKVVDSIPKKKLPEVLPALNTALPPIEKRPAVHVDPVDVKKNVDVLPVKPSADLVDMKNRQLEAALLAAIQSAEKHVQQATEHKVTTIKAIETHANLVKQTVDDAQNADWEKVTGALQTAESLSKKDVTSEARGRNEIDNLRAIIREGKASDITSKNSLILNATETANKLSHQLDELNGMANKARQESSVLNQYKDLIERSRQQFALEMKSILPNVDLNAKDKKLNEDELNALIAHAHLKVDQLRKQLTEQQVREEQNIAKAIEEQRKADERIAQDILSIETNRVRQQQDLEIERALLSSRTAWESNLEDQLKRASAAHSEHLEDVIRTQRQLFEIEHNQKVEEAVLVERDQHSRVVGSAISRLEGIEHALNSRVALDAENRKAKQFWIACHNLIDTIKFGKKSGNDMEQRRFPLEESLSVLKEVNPDDEFANTLIESFAEQTKTKGVYTEQDLKNRFDTVYKLGRRTATIDENGGGLGTYFWSYVRSLFLLDIPRKYSYDDKFDPISLDNIEILSRAKWFLDHKDLESAVRVAQLLRGQPAQLAKDWIADSRIYLETQLLAQLLVAHAAVSSIRSTY